MLPNAYFLAKFRFDKAENEPAKNLQNVQKLLMLPIKRNFMKKLTSETSPTKGSSDRPPRRVATGAFLPPHRPSAAERGQSFLIERRQPRAGALGHSLSRVPSLPEESHSCAQCRRAREPVLKKNRRMRLRGSSEKTKTAWPEE